MMTENGYGIAYGNNMLS